MRPEYSHDTRASQTPTINLKFCSKCHLAIKLKHLDLNKDFTGNFSICTVANKI